MTKNSRKKNKKKRGYMGSFLHGVGIVLRLFLCLAVMGVLAVGVVLYHFRDEISACREKAQVILANTKPEDFSKPADTHIYDVDGSLIGTINSGHYEYVYYEDISPFMVQAYVAQEDRRFYEHHGIDVIGIARAGVALIKNNGEITQGGSTITQQVIKNTYLTQEKTFERKLTEIMTARDFEKIYSKSQIIEFYCNTNYYANRCYGIKEASHYYFDKDAKDLTLWEAATLAGISNNPSRYDPVKHPENAVEKRNQILENMLKEEMISDAEYRHAIRQELTVAQVYEGGTPENYQTSYAIHCAALELMRNDGFPFQYVFDNKDEYDIYRELYNSVYQEKSTLIRNGGYEIHTSLDSNIQSLLQQTVDGHLKDFTELQDNGKYALQGAAVCVDNKSGYVVAIVGGRGTDDEFNRGYLSKRQPGSTIKPLIDYAPAFETGFYYPSKIMDDHKFEDGPKNSGDTYRGRVSVREALNRSINTVAWQVLDDIGVDTGMSYLGKLHFAGLSSQDNGNLSMSIGGFTDGARVVDMAKGYSVLANYGQYSSRTCIKDIISQFDGNVYHEQPDETVFTADTAYIITDILKGTLSKPYGTGYGLGLNVPCAGKTGTTNSNKDTWFCGYTRYYTTAVWVGYDTPRAMPGVYGKTYSGRMWSDFMKQLHQDLPVMDWEMPSTVYLANVDSDGEKTDVETGVRDLFSSIADSKATADYQEKQQHDIRRAVDKGLADYETFEIQTVTDTYQVDSVYNNLKAQIVKLEDIEARDSLLKRLDTRYAKLLKDREPWGPQIAQYEEELRIAESQAAQNSHDSAVAGLEGALAELNSLSYRSDDTQQKLDNAAALLAACVGFPEYEALHEAYESAVNRVNALPDKETWERENLVPLGPGYFSTDSPNHSGGADTPMGPKNPGGTDNLGGPESPGGTEGFNGPKSPDGASEPSGMDHPGGAADETVEAGPGSW